MNAISLSARHLALLLAAVLLAVIAVLAVSAQSDASASSSSATVAGKSFGDRQSNRLLGG